MEIEKYQKLAESTESKLDRALVGHVSDIITWCQGADQLKRKTFYQDITTGTKELSARECRILHGALGLITEGGELLESLLKEELDLVNFKEEVGDVAWYFALLLNVANELEIGTDDILETNIAKLKARFPNKFESDKALNRDLDKEREVLETVDAPHETEECKTCGRIRPNVEDGVCVDCRH